MTVETGARFAKDLSEAERGIAFAKALLPGPEKVELVPTFRDGFEVAINDRSIGFVTMESMANAQETWLPICEAVVRSIHVARGETDADEAAQTMARIEFV